MKPLSKHVFTAVFLFVICFSCGAFAQQTQDKEGHITVPWNEMKRFLNLDSQEIVLSMEIFQKLLAYTGVAAPPSHTVSGGNVILTRNEFKKLVDQMKPPSGHDVLPPFDYLITKAFYNGKMTRNNTIFTGTFTVHVLKKDAYLKVPILSQSLALEDIRIDGKQALIVSEKGYHHVVLSKTGTFTVTASFALKSVIDKGPHKLDLIIQRTPITLLKLEIPLKDIEVSIPEAQQLRTTTRGNTTVVSAVVSSGNRIGIQWQKKIAVTEKVPPKLYTDLFYLVSIEDDVLKINSDINYNILHSNVEEVRLTIPENMNILSVTGEGVGEWQEAEQQKQRLVRIPFTYGKKGKVLVHVTAEVGLSELGTSNVFTGFQTLESVRETGFLGITLNTSAELIVTKIDGMEKIAPQKLPARLINKSAKPIMLGFKYLKHPYHLALEVKKHEKVSVPIATINSASAVTLCTEDGKVVHRLVYQVRNSAKQFLEIQVPKEADVWSVFVDNQPVESSLRTEQKDSEHRKLLVPLIRSKAVNKQLGTFPVEVILALSEDRFSWYATKSATLPTVDLLTSQLFWSVYLPNDYAYHYFDSTLEKEEIIRGLNIFSKAQRFYDQSAMREVSELAKSKEMDELKKVYKGEEAQSRFRNIPVQKQQVTSQMAAEMEFSGRLAGLAGQDKPSVTVSGSGAIGILPIMIQVPTSGQVYRFAKTIIKPEDHLTFSVVYTQLWLGKLIKWGIFILIILLLFFNRNRLRGPWKWVKNLFYAAMQFYKQHQQTLKKIAGSLFTPFLLVGLIFLSWPFSTLLSAIFLLLFWLIVVYQVQRYFRRKKEDKRKEDVPDQRP
ncbi:MAG: DUF308 domain-containing protein [Thermodesulfobacteriota bacterium]|nr:DUF308 domain-containing protein [Thermodesulfobacteriota bacterium]